MRIAAVSLHDVTTVVRRAVVQQYQLEVLVRLPQNAFDALIEKRRMVVVGHYDGDCRHGLFEDSFPHDGKPLSNVEEEETEPFAAIIFAVVAH